MAIDGRKPVLTRTLAEKLCAVFERGTIARLAAQACAVKFDTLRKWLWLGKKGKEGPHVNGQALPGGGGYISYAEFFVMWKQSESRSEQSLIEIVRNHADSKGPGVVHAAYWLLERRWPHRWHPDRFRVREMEKRLAELEASLKGNRLAGVKD